MLIAGFCCRYTGSLKNRVDDFLVLTLVGTCSIGADKKKQTGNGATPLIYASENGQGAVARILHGAGMRALISRRSWIELR